MDNDQAAPVLLYTLINRATPRAPSARCKVLLLRAGETVRFVGGIQVRMKTAYTGRDAQHDMTLAWGDAAQRAPDGTLVEVHAYEPVTLVEPCGVRVVPRAVVTRDGVPLAVLLDIEGVTRDPASAIEVAA